MTFRYTFSERLKLNNEECWCWWELLCTFKTFFPVQRSPPIPGDHWHSLAFIQCSSGAIPATMGSYECFLNVRKRWPDHHVVMAPWVVKIISYTYDGIHGFARPGIIASIFSVMVGLWLLEANSETLFFFILVGLWWDFVLCCCGRPLIGSSVGMMVQMISSDLLYSGFCLGTIGPLKAVLCNSFNVLLKLSGLSMVYLFSILC